MLHQYWLGVLIELNFHELDIINSYLFRTRLQINIEVVKSENKR